jgi:hypothetical protein
VEGIAATDELDGLVAQDANALIFQGVRDGLMQMAVPADAQGISDREVVIAQDCKNTVRRLEAPQNLGDAMNVLETFMNEIASQNCQIGTLRLGQLDSLGEIGGGDLSAAMEIGKLNDPQPGKGIGQIGNGDLVMRQFQPGRLDAGGIM